MLKVLHTLLLLMTSTDFEISSSPLSMSHHPMNDFFSRHSYNIITLRLVFYFGIASCSPKTLPIESQWILSFSETLFACYCYQTFSSPPVCSMA